MSTELLANRFPEWSVPKIDEKTGIRERHIAGETECASDLAFEAAKKLFASGVCKPEEIDFILLCTQSPDYILPTTACLLQHRLGIPTTAGALDFSLGSSGFVYGIGLAKGLIETRQAKNVLLLTAETYSKYIHDEDRSCRTIFGDGAAATLVGCTESERDLIGPVIYGTDGSGAEGLIVRAGAAREPKTEATGVPVVDDSGNVRSADNLFMDGAQIFTFTIAEVPPAVKAVLEKSGLTREDIDLFVFHQANKYMLDHLRRRTGIPAEKFAVSLSHCGNTGSSSIPIALSDAVRTGTLKAGMKVMLTGFGPGLSWGAVILDWTGALSPS